MNHVEVTLYFNELQLKAVQEELAADGLTLEDKLKEHFAFLYDQLVPPEKQLGIEAEIEQIEAQENAEREARRKFGVFHVHAIPCGSASIDHIQLALYLSISRRIL